MYAPTCVHENSTARKSVAFHESSRVEPRGLAALPPDQDQPISVLKRSTVRNALASRSSELAIVTEYDRSHVPPSVPKRYA